MYVCSFLWSICSHGFLFYSVIIYYRTCLFCCSNCPRFDQFGALPSFLSNYFFFFNNFFCVCVCVGTPHDLWGLSLPNQGLKACIGSMESYPVDCQGSPHSSGTCHFYKEPWFICSGKWFLETKIWVQVCLLPLRCHCFQVFSMDITKKCV